MGLTIHYEIRLPRGNLADAKALTQTLRRRAVALQRRGEVKDVLPSTTDRAELARWAVSWKLRRVRGEDNTSTGIAVEPLEGCIFPVAIGDDCEPLWLGLCRYPAAVTHNGRAIATRLERGWRLRGACKTQYASLQGWEHFRRCHTTVITLLRAVVELGATVRIIDEGGWWPSRSDDTLRRKLDEMNGIVAAFAGAVKDASEDNGGAPVVSPIFAHPQFERLEAEGVARTGEQLGAATQIVSSIGRRLPRRPNDPDQ